MIPYVVPTPDDLKDVFMSPKDAQVFNSIGNKVRRRFLRLLRGGNSVISMNAITHDEFPPGYYALHRYCEEYWGYLKELTPEMEDAGWSVTFHEDRDYKGRMTVHSYVKVEVRQRDDNF